MSKKMIKFVGGSLLIIAVLSISTILYFGNRNGSDIQAIEPTDFVVGGEASASSSSEVDMSKYEIKPLIKTGTTANVIEEPAVSSPEVTETSDGSGGTVQTPNWEAQKQLPPDTDISNPDSQPEYVKSETAKSSNGSNTGSTPKNGDTKTMDGDTYTYVSGFGWVKDGNGGSTEYIEAPTTGNKVGY